MPRCSRNLRAIFEAPTARAPATTGLMISKEHLHRTGSKSIELGPIGGRRSTADHQRYLLRLAAGGYDLLRIGAAERGPVPTSRRRSASDDDRSQTVSSPTVRPSGPRRTSTSLSMGGEADQERTTRIFSDFNSIMTAQSSG